MKLPELSRLPFKERFKVVKDLLRSDSELHSDAQIVNEIFEKTIEWFKGGSRLADPNMLSKLKDTKQDDLPPIFETIYSLREKSVISELPNTEIIRLYNDSRDRSLLSNLEDAEEKLPSFFEAIDEAIYGRTEYGMRKLPRNERQELFDKDKEYWCLHYPDFKRISDLMEAFRTNELLVEYITHSPPAFIHDKAIEVYKKCLSFRVKITKKVLSPLLRHPADVRNEYADNHVDFCINRNVVKAFVKSYQEWHLKIHNLWNKTYYMYQDFFSNAGYDRTSWKTYIKYSDSLKCKADEMQQTQEEVLSLLRSGKEIVANSDQAITLEYEKNATEISLYKRELEILEMSEGEGDADEEYCYVYTLECPICVFYVGIAADPKERLEQHIRGASSDEAHLFKSQFIQKYRNDVKQNIVFEGIRRDCKRFERDYIAENNPLGNMTEGGEG